MTENDHIYLGIDVGTGSARAGLFNASGTMLAMTVQPIKMWKPEPDFVEQSSEDIWRACCTTVKAAMKEAGVDAARIRGIGFDATCSLVVLDKEDQPLSISPTGQNEQNVMVWMDHRAIGQAEQINQRGHDVLRYVGGVISPEMETPKLLWLKENRPDIWEQAGLFFDLPDYLVYRATGRDVRSLCSTVCKWTYLGHESSEESDSVGRWDDSYWRNIGLGELVDEKYSRIGNLVRPMGEAVGSGLSETSAKELGLRPGTPVSISIIDAHAGGLGLLGACLDDRSPTPETLETRVALIGGTSSCHMAVSREANFVPGVWGPYYSAILPDMWLTEGGQSATGALIDNIIFSHAQSTELKTLSETEDKSVYQLLNEHLEKMSTGRAFPAELTRDLHLLPYFHGNRSPRADPTLKGMISGLRLSSTMDDLALLYLAAIQGIAYGTRHIIEEMNQNGFRIDTIFACGGGTKNPVFLREHADITGCQIALPEEPEAVLLGSAILGATASGDFPSMMDAMAVMNRTDRIISPASGDVSRYHAAKYKVFHAMYSAQMEWRDTLSTE